jgi:hypothetical protein
MCIADMVETIINEWTPTDWHDPLSAAQRDFPSAISWEVDYAMYLASSVHLAEGETLVSIDFIEDPVPRRIYLPGVMLRPYTIRRTPKPRHTDFFPRQVSDFFPDSSGSSFKILWAIRHVGGFRTPTTVQRRSRTVPGR